MRKTELEHLVQILREEDMDQEVIDEFKRIIAQVDSEEINFEQLAYRTLAITLMLAHRVDELEKTLA